MTLNSYQKKAMSTCMRTSANFGYMMLNLVGEVGEFASKVAKSIRKGDALLGCSSQLLYTCTYDKADERNEELKKEAGDILWQLSGLCKIMGWTLEEVAQMNLDKLATRKANHTIDGNGDGVTKEERL